MPRVGS
ncbi:hypothetical protein VCHE16_3448, partial [Vibrio paracholerae HE-16]